MITFMLQLLCVHIYRGYIYVGAEAQCEIAFLSGTIVHTVNNSKLFHLHKLTF